MHIPATNLLDDLYEQFTEISDRIGGDSSSPPFVHGYRSGLARARLFVLDEQATESSLIL